MGIRTIGDAAASDRQVLISILGENSGNYIYESSNGHGSTNVSGNYEDAKSYSNETTLSSDLTADSYDKDIVPVLRYLSQSVSKRLKRDHVFGKTVTVSVKTGNFRRHSAQMQLDNSINDEEELMQYSKKLADKLLLGDSGLFIKGEVVRLVGVGVTKLDDGSYRQLSLFDSIYTQKASSTDNERQKKLDKMTEELDNRFGKNSVFKGSSM